MQDLVFISYAKSSDRWKSKQTIAFQDLWKWIFDLLWVLHIARFVVTHENWLPLFFFFFICNSKKLAKIECTFVMLKYTDCHKVVLAGLFLCKHNTLDNVACFLYALAVI